MQVLLLIISIFIVLIPHQLTHDYVPAQTMVVVCCRLFYLKLQRNDSQLAIAQIVPTDQSGIDAHSVAAIKWLTISSCAFLVATALDSGAGLVAVYPLVNALIM